MLHLLLVMLVSGTKHLWPAAPQLGMMVETLVVNGDSLASSSLVPKIWLPKLDRRLSLVFLSRCKCCLV